MKQLPPSLREKTRYMKFKVHAEEEQEIGDVVNTVWNACLNYMGSKGSAEANFWVIGNKFDEEKQEGIIRVNRDEEDDLRAALALAKDINGSKGFFEIKKVSGSIKKLEE